MMSTVGVNVASMEFDAAQALLDLQSNIRETKQEQYVEIDGRESVETAKLFLSCFIASNVPSPPVMAMTSSTVGTCTPMFEPNITAVKSELASRSSLSPKRRSPEQELPCDLSINSYPIEESCNKRSRIFKRKPIKHFTVTSEPNPMVNTAANKIKHCNCEVNVHEVIARTRDVGTQTDEELELSVVKTLEITIRNLCDKIKTLEDQIQSNSQLMETLNRDITDNDDYENDDDDESYKVDESNTFDSDLDESITESDTPIKARPKSKAGQSSRHHGFHNPAQLLINKNLNANGREMVPIGDGNAFIPSRIYRNINWNSYTSATRKLLAAVFSRRVLATHSLTGKPSPAFPNKPAKKKLDSSLVNDIVQTVVERCGVPENVVRTSITTKCADESKMFRSRQQNKKKRKQKVNGENIPPDSDSDEF